MDIAFEWLMQEMDRARDRLPDFSAAEIADAAEQRQMLEDGERQHREEMAKSEALRGEGPFWPENPVIWPDGSKHYVGPKCDWNQELVIMRAVRRAFCGIGLTDAERWEIVQRATMDLIERYAEEWSK